MAFVLFCSASQCTLGRPFHTVSVGNGDGKAECAELSINLFPQPQTLLKRLSPKFFNSAASKDLPAGRQLPKSTERGPPATSLVILA
ncbi:hypothetical protein CPAR01_02662 [Colletotrichum paranaense]|uniref:Uncharacterized protein n=3 Tax=Colletotrichum acutatum species complex TaxID=2707335 RepID=A0AAI9UQT0_9PEZI|nr:uncharacterized protein CPAR01_02662 [Colletotrichum paranaense]XP_060375715.1 uncharacterized protein CTAM01_13702 [Colletotrichum tamarilloi]KAK1460364.1 hypothetical protein CMEL01_03363 [Colletotrichum melonis]KAK1482139.1 hypothetical protein CTAM01_13702 [Colletotrichum tamarilloi]KAK1545160.1 hypothetical protein CPAR01_02662 [Colletotrichum paranaense]